eukprot:sb/3469526/
MKEAEDRKKTDESKDKSSLLYDEHGWLIGGGAKTDYITGICNFSLHVIINNNNIDSLYPALTQFIYRQLVFLHFKGTAVDCLLLARFSWIESYLTNRTARVKIGSVESEARSISIGVPQGSILGPLLFILYTRDLQKIAELYGLNLHMYADDSQLSISFTPETFDDVINKVQRCVSHIRLWMTQNLLKLNPDKTEVLILRNKWDKSTSDATLNIVQEETEVKQVAKK